MAVMHAASGLGELGLGELGLGEMGLGEMGGHLYGRVCLGCCRANHAADPTITRYVAIGYLFSGSDHGWPIATGDVKVGGL